MIKIEDFRDFINEKKGQKKQVLENIRNLQKEISNLKKQSYIIEESQIILQEVSEKIQSKLKYQISELVTLALDIVFEEDSYDFEIEFVKKRGKTEALFWFINRKTGNRLDPINANGGGYVDVAAFALRVVLWNMKRPKKTRNTFILDEPFKHLRGKKQQERTGKMLKEISKKIKGGLQIIIISDVLFTLEADKVFEITQTNGISSIKEL